MSFARYLVSSVSLLSFLVGCHNGSSSTTTPAALVASAAVVNQLPIDTQLFGYAMTVDGCYAYVAMQNNLLTGKLAVVNLCGTGSAVGASPALLSETPGSYAAMNGITKSGNQLYVTYGWATNPVEVWTVAGGAASPQLQGCAPMFSDFGYTSCNAAASGYGSLYGGPATLLGSDLYVAENSDDIGQAVQIVNVANPAAPAKLALPAGITGGQSSNGSPLAGLWAKGSVAGAQAAGSALTLYVGTIAVTSPQGESATITAYDAGSNPTTPVKMGVAWNVPAGFTVENMAATGTTVVAALWNSFTGAVQIVVVSFQNPAAPTASSVQPTPGCIPGNRNFIALSGKYALMGCSTAGTLRTGIEVLDVSNLTAPVLLGQMGTSLYHVDAISVQGRYVYATDDVGNLNTLDAGTLFQ